MGNSGETIAEPNREDAGVIYNATLIEPALEKGDCIVEDDSSFWSTKDSQEDFLLLSFSHHSNRSASIEITLMNV